MCDVRPEQYAGVIREMIRHEDDVTNHRLMWLLIAQGFLLSASIGAKRARASDAIACLGILVILSAFVVLYKSYQARGYLQCLGELAKRGQLKEKDLQFDGWPTGRVPQWRRIWICPWLSRVGDVLDPCLFLPDLLLSMWLFVLLQGRTQLPSITVFGVAAFTATVIMSVFCIVWVWLRRNEEETETVQSSLGQSLSE
jgi:hypothetical protein